jgi:8-oxo-dGTP diphosphatase
MVVREFACAVLIDTSGRFLLQQRDDVPGIVYPGRISLFGGHREPGETFLQCVVREIHEETSYFFPPERFECLARWSHRGPDGPNTIFEEEFFVLNDVPAERLAITEGALLICKESQLESFKSKLTPSARFALTTYFEKNSPTGFGNIDLQRETLKHK